MTDHFADAGKPMPTLELAELLEQNALMPLDDVAAAELRRLHAELVEADALRKKMSDILRRTAKPRWGNQTDSGQNKLPPSADRWKKRSETYQGIASAMAQQWGAL